MPLTQQACRLKPRQRVLTPGATTYGSTMLNIGAGPAPATGNSVQTISYSARIYRDRANPAQGTYTDNVVVDVSF